MKVLFLDYKAMSSHLVDELRELGHNVDYSSSYRHIRREGKELYQYDFVFAHQPPQILGEMARQGMGLEAQIYLYSSSVKPEDGIHETIESDGNLHVFMGLLNRRRILSIIGAPSE